MRRYAPLLRLAATSPLSCLRVAGWTSLAIRRLRRDLDAIGLEATAQLAHAPAAPAQQRPIVVALLRVVGATCLVRSAVLQRWDADHGRRRALVIGVAPSAGAGYVAHAWLEGEGADRYVELHRRPVPGCTVWLTGRPGAGKSTIARGLADRLRAAGGDPLVLDGDEIRRTISADLGFSDADRDENVRRVAALAQRRSAAGGLTIVALISPLRRQRAGARRAIGAGFLEVYVDAPLEECIRRDPKGLYARAQAGEIPDFTGISSPYEAPREADLVLDTVAQTVEESVMRVLALLDGRPG